MLCILPEIGVICQRANAMRLTGHNSALRLRLAYESRDGVLVQTEMAQYQVFPMKEIRSIVCMAQAGPEIPSHVLSFMQEHPELRGETLVKVYEDKTELLNAH